MARKAGQIIARGQSTWLVRVYLGRDPQTETREYHNQTIHGPLHEAQRLLNLKLQQRDNGRVSRPAVLSLNQLLDQWLTTVVKARVRTRTFKDYEALLKLYIRPALGSRLIGTVSQIDIQSLYAQMFEHGLSARTIEYTNAVLRSAFGQAVRWKVLAEDPCVGVDLPRMSRKEMQALSVDECRRFLEIAEKSEWFPLLALALTTGMRPSEYLALKWSDIEWQRGTASVCRTIQVSRREWTFDDTKRKRSRRVVKLQNFVLKALQNLREKQDGKREGNCSAAHELIFTSAAGLPLKQRAVKREFRRLLGIAGIRSVRLYDLRHTAATLGIAAGVSVKVISDQLGHASISFTLERYSHVLPSIQDEAGRLRLNGYWLHEPSSDLEHWRAAGSMPTLVSIESVLASRWCPGAGPRHGCLNYESSESAARPCIGVQREEGIQQNEASNRRKSNFVEELAQFHI